MDLALAMSLLISAVDVSQSDDLTG